MEDPSLLMNLPPEITIDILSRLPIRSILCCKLVCKSWFRLLETPEFVKFHLSKSVPGLIVYHSFSDLFRLFEFKDELDLVQHELHYVPVTEFEGKTVINHPRANIIVEASVNGLLYLRDIVDDHLYVCNPITREYINLPNPQGIIYRPGGPNPIIKNNGFGVSKTTDQYKVVRIYNEYVRDPTTGTSFKYVCRVYTLGTTSWRTIVLHPSHSYSSRSNGIFLDGNLHWLVSGLKGTLLILCFDLETELFNVFSLPPGLQGCAKTLGDVAVLSDCLCFCDCTSDKEVVIWIMKEYGIEKSWTKEVVIIGKPPYRVRDYIYSIKVFKDGDILLFDGYFHVLYYSSKTKTYSEIDMFKLHNIDFRVDARLHVSSFISLKSFAIENVRKFCNRECIIHNYECLEHL